MKTDILIIDDESEWLDTLGVLFGLQGWNVRAELSGARALKTLEEQEFDLILCDLAMPGMSGLDLLKRLRADGNRTPFIVMTGVGTIKSAVEAMQFGAYNYITKPFDADELELLARRAVEYGRLNRRIEASARRDEVGAVAPLMGAGRAMEEVLSTVGKIADSLAPVLIQGETGTGKSLLARHIHALSERREQPFLTIDCGALPENLLEAELFGYEKGAFTGALNTGKPGMVEEANGGTLFLDEINSLPLALQGKLLRVLESHKSKRLGAVSEREIDFRLLAATNQDLKTCVEKGSFRADLYYRLNVIPLEIPPLRNRREDIIPLALFFLDHFCKKYGRTKVFTKGVFNQMMCYDWPGNVRELKNVVERLLITSSVGTMEIRQMPENLLGEGSVPPPPPEVYPADWESIYQYDPEDFSLKKYMNFCEKQVVAAALKRCGSSYKAAELLKTDQSTIIRKRQKYGIS